MTRQLRALSGWAVLFGSIGACGSTEPPGVQTPAQLQKISGDAQIAPAGATLPLPLVLQVNDSRGNPVPGITVIFTVLQGEGSVSTPTATTGTDGRVATSFTTGTISGSAQEVSAVVQSTTISVSFTATAAPDLTAFNIDIRFLSVSTPTQRRAFTDAALRWEASITQDVEDGLLDVPADSSCGTGWPAVSQNIDDLIILVRLVPIDGPGNVLATAGPCWVRDPSLFTILGEVEIDTADLPTLDSAELSSLVLHEMGHVLGFGSLWPDHGLLADPSLPPNPADPPNSGADPHFTGTQAINAFNNVGGTAYVAGAKVPVEDNEIRGAADGHWRESVFGNELMTAYVDPGLNPLSVVTLASLADEGYAVDLATADAFSSLMLSLRAFDDRPRLLLKNDLRRGPVRKVDRTGRVTGELRR